MDSAAHLYSKHSPLSIPTGALNLTSLYWNAFSDTVASAAFF